MSAQSNQQQFKAHRTTSYLVKHGIGRTLLYLVLLAGMVVVAFPMFWLTTGSVKTESDLTNYPVIWIQSTWAWSNFQTLFDTVPFWTYFRNTVFITVCCVAGTTMSSSIVAYSFARLRFPFKNVLFILMLSTLMVPYFVILIPQFIMFKDLGWLDSYAPLIVPWLFANPAYTFLLRQFFMTMPADMEDAAKIDGCGYFRTYWNIGLPMVRPALIAVGAFAFLQNWNDFLAPLIYLQTPDNFTLQLGLAQLQSQYSTHFDLIMAGSFLTVVPCIVLFFLVQRWFIQGIVVTGVKG